jgi:hypothetical protein
MDTVTITQEIKTFETRELKLPKFVLNSQHSNKDGLNLCEATSDIFESAGVCCPTLDCPDCIMNHIKVTKE